MSKEEIEKMLKELEELKKANAEKDQALADKDAIIAEALSQNEALVVASQAKEVGEYAELYTEEEVDYILTSPVVYDTDKKSKVKSADYFASHPGKAKILVEGGSVLIKRKEVK